MSKVKKNTKVSFMMLLLPWVILLICEIFYCHQYFLRVSVSSLSPDLQKSMHVKAETIAVIAASFYYSYMITQLFTGVLIDRFGSKIILTVATALCTIGCVLFAYSNTAFYTEIARVLMGVGAAFAFVNTLALARGWFNEKIFSLINGATLTIGTLGAILGTTALSELMQSDSWRYIIICMAILSLVLVVCVLIFIRDNDEVIKIRNQNKHLGFFSTIKQSLGAAIAIKAVWINGLYLGFFYVIISTFASLWCISYYREIYTKSNTFVDFTPSFIFVGLGIGALVFSWLSNLSGKPVLLIRLGSFIFLILTASALYINLPEMLLAVILFLIGFVLGSSVLAFVIVIKWAKVTCRASAIALVNLLQMSVGAVLLPIMGYVLDVDTVKNLHHKAYLFSISDYHITFLFIIISSIIAIILTFFIRIPKPGEDCI